MILALGGVQHRGQHGTGFASNTVHGLHQGFGQGKIDSSLRTLDSRVLIKLAEPSFWTMGHCRYSTQGGQSSDNLQPCIEDDIVVAHNGEFVFTDPQLRDLTGVLSDTRIFTRLLAQNNADIIKTLDTSAKGAYSLAIGIGRDMFVIRDPHGIRPLFTGKLLNGIMTASETIALEIAGATEIEEVPPGVLMKLTEYGSEIVGITRERSEDVAEHFCLFEFAYFSRPDSRYKIDGEWQSVAQIRERHGKLLAQSAPVPQASFIVSIPDSGEYSGAGYAEQMLTDGYKIPLKKMVVRDHYHQLHGEKRGFQADLDPDRAAVISGKTSVIRDDRWKDAVVVVVDDSNVRGDNAKEKTIRFFDLGAKEVHWRFAFPRVVDSCHLGVNMKTPEELIAVRNDSDDERIAKEIGSTSVAYISPEDYIRGIYGNNISPSEDPSEIFLRNGGCGGCLTGNHPVRLDGTSWQPVQMGSTNRDH